MKSILEWSRNAGWFSLGVSVAVVLLFGAVMVQSATTISTNITTGGTLGVTDLSTLTGGFVSQASSTVVGAFTGTGAVAASSTLQVTGAVTNYSTLTQAGAVWASSTLQATGASRFYADSIFDGGIDALTLTHADTATSSLTVGCIDTYATSTASPIKYMLFASSTLNIDGASVTGGFGGGTMEGLVLWGFGSCS